jgi:hypothetical protein
MASTVPTPPITAVAFFLIVFCVTGCIPARTVWRTCEGPVTNETRIALTDQNLNRLSDVSILVTNVADGAEWNLRTDLAGTVVANLPPGDYRVRAVLDDVERESSFEVREGCDTSLNVRLELGGS